MLTALASASCTAPLGPSYTIERQRLEVTYNSTPQSRVSVRAAWRVKNTGDRPLPAVEVRLPKANTHRRRGLHVESGGKEILPAAAESAEKLSIAFQPPLAVKAKREIAVSYDLTGTSSEATGVVLDDGGFVLPPGDWAPVLLPPAAAGSFASGGEPPRRWEITVRVPASFRVHASGRERGRKKEKDGIVVRFEQRREGVAQFVVGGAYREERIATGSAAVIFWTRQAMPRGLAQRAAEATTRTAKFYDVEFGERDTGAHALWIVECPLEERCWPVPGAALPGREVDTPEFWSDRLSLIDRQLAFTWLDFRVHPDWDAEPLPMSALADYAADLADIAQEGDEARRRIVHGLLQNLTPSQARTPETAILSVGLSDPEPVRQYARLKSQVFFFALEDAAGKENLRRALLHLLRAYSGRTWRAVDLRAAIEQESGKDLAAVFREWLTEPGIPEEFRKRY